MAVDNLTSAILQYIDDGAYPEAENVASAELPPEALENLLIELRKAQEDIKDEIRTLSRAAAPDIDTWIERAKQLQLDIQRSRDTAREIVRAAEEGKTLRAGVEDAGSKTKLLQKEVAFNETLVETLERLKQANAVLDEAQEEAIHGRLKPSMVQIQEADSAIEGLGDVENTRAFGLLKARSAEVKTSIAQTATKHWNALITVNTPEKRIIIRKVDGAPDINIHDVVLATTGLNTFDAAIQRLKRDVDACILRPRMTVDKDGNALGVHVSGKEIRLYSNTDGNGTTSLIGDLKDVIEYLATRLPSSVGLPLSKLLVPSLSTRLVEDWLEPSIPLDIAKMLGFQETLNQVDSLADHIQKVGWSGSNELRDWVQSAARAWLTKRRETVLGDVRNLIFAGLIDRNVVERVETQVIKGDDELAGGNGGNSPGKSSGNKGDDWDAWDENEEEPSASSEAATPPAENTDDDETSAWELPDDDDTKVEDVDRGEGEAWGWGDEDGNAPDQLQSPTASRKEAVKVNGDRQPAQLSEREMTLRETYTVTAIPDAILEAIQRVISDAQTLGGPEYASSPIAPAAVGLYALPTLALAIYRATAPTAYSKAEYGNMLIYNDSRRLAEQLTAWQASQPASSRLRLKSDVTVLEQFAKRAYNSEMESQRTIVKDLLDTAQGFTNCTVPPFSGSCDDAVSMTVDHLRTLNRSWNGVLPSSVLLYSLGLLLETVTAKMITEIEELGDISEPESHKLKALCEKVSEVKDLFPQQQREDGEWTETAFVYCPNWLRFQYLGEVLESNLAEIRYLWNDTGLSLEFDAEEIVELIEALFAESDLRRNAIREVRRGGRR